MKIQCDVCTKDEASVFCTADDAALCDGCDHRVHHANKLAGKHHRFSLLHPPSPAHFPLCDICKEKRAFLFCQQDRAILCRDCDYPIHKANEHTRSHSRFLLTGVKLSATATAYSPAAAAASDSISVPDLKKSQKGTAQISIEKPVPVKLPVNIHDSPFTAAAVKTTALESNISSISEYLIETIPGWRVEDLLDSPPPFSFGFSEATGTDALPIWDVDFESNHLSCSFSPPEALPPAPPIFPTHHQYPSSNISFGGQMSFKESKEVANNKKSSRNRRSDDGCFVVPQISSPCNPSSKRSSTFW